MPRDVTSVEQSQLQKSTAAHYDAYPFEFITSLNAAAVRDFQAPALREFVDAYVTSGARVADIGCGPGRATLFLLQTGADVVAVDISQQSIKLARTRCPGAAFMRANNLALPLKDNSFDIVVSDGVLHHTPDARTGFAENARITRESGLLFVGVYNRHRYYYYLYNYVGLPIRWMEKHPVGRALMFTTVVPLYWALHLVKSRGARTWKGAVNLFYDYFVTPQASFHTYEEVCGWGQRESLELVHYDPVGSNVHVFVFRKVLQGARQQS